MQTIAEILTDGARPRRDPTPNPSRASTPSNEGPAKTLIRASEAAVAGYITAEAAPEPTTCQFCGRTLEHMGIISPLMSGSILLWSPEPERCTCQEAAAYWERHDREEAERKAEEERRKKQAAFQAKIDRLLRQSGIGGRFQQRTFETWEITPENGKAYRTCKRYADSFHMMLPVKKADGRVQPPEKARNGLFMVGSYGTGKTHLAAAIANQLLRDGTPVICMTMIDMLARIKESFDKATEGSEAQIIRLYSDVPLLIIDDLGSEQPTEWGSTTIFRIMNARYEALLPTIVTTNCGVEELVQRMTPRDGTDRNARKTIERLQETCVGVQMDWPSWRTK